MVIGLEVHVITTVITREMIGGATHGGLDLWLWW
jgi:hypothetical protein